MSYRGILSNIINYIREIDIINTESFANNIRSRTMSKKAKALKDPEGNFNENAALENFKAIMDSGFGVPPKPTEAERKRSIRQSKSLERGVNKAIKNYEKTGSFSGKKKN